MSRVAEYYMPEVYGDVSSYDRRHRAEIVDLAQVKAGSKIKKGSKASHSKDDGKNGDDEAVSMYEDLLRRYYQTFLELVKAAGEYSWIVAVEKNADAGIYPVQKVKYDYFDNEAQFQQAKQDRRQACWRLAHDLNNLSHGLGLGSYSKDGLRLFVNFLVNSELRRAWFCSRIKKYQKSLEPHSISELWERRIELDKRLSAKKGST